MTYGYYIIVGIGLILLQTAVIPGIAVLNTCFDFVGLFVIYLGFSRPVREALPTVFILGLLADNLSGAPFMLYITAYGWVFFSVRVLSQILQVSLRFRTALIVVAGVLMQNLIFILTFALLGPGSHSPAAATGSVIIQLIWAFTLGPLLLLGFKITHGIWDNRIGREAVGRSEAK
jgi:rod shape-determining protein MreD